MTADAIRFVGPDHSYWSVYEVSDAHGRPWAGRSLIFVSDIGFRRVRNYPSNWREMGPNELYELSWQK